MWHHPVICKRVIFSFYNIAKDKPLIISKLEDSCAFEVSSGLADERHLQDNDFKLLYKDSLILSAAISAIMTLNEEGQDLEAPLL